MGKQDKKYCMLCGNPLNPKIHIMELAKTSNEVEKQQKKLLKMLMKEIYYRKIVKSESFGEGIVEKLNAKE